MKDRRNYIEEIRSKYSRLKRRSPYAKQTQERIYAVVEGFRYLKALPKSKFRDEYLKYGLIGYVSSLEGYCRLAAAEFIDRGEPYIDNAARLEEIKIDLSSVVAICKDQVSVGQYVSHLLTLNGLRDINSVFSRILGIDFLGELKKIDYLFLEDGTQWTAATTLFDGSDIAQVEEIFRLRHVYVHELAAKEGIRVRHFERCISGAASLFGTAETLFEVLRRRPNKAPEPTTMAVTPRATSPMSK